MFDFEDYERLGDYVFTYPAKEVIDSEYQRWIRTQKKRVAPWMYREFIVGFVKERITFGNRKYGEVEPEWETLLHYIKEVETEFNTGNSVALEKAVILYDQALLLLLDTHPLPPNYII